MLPEVRHPRHPLAQALLVEDDARQAGVTGQIANQHGNVGCTNGTELNFSYGGSVPRKISVKVETLGRAESSFSFSTSLWSTMLMLAPVSRMNFRWV